MATADMIGKLVGPGKQEQDSGLVMYRDLFAGTECLFFFLSVVSPGTPTTCGPVGRCLGKGGTDEGLINSVGGRPFDISIRLGRHHVGITLR